MLSSFLWWAGVDSNHRSLATADLQSAPFSHSGTYPSVFVYLIVKLYLNLPSTRIELVTSPLPRECSTSEPQGLVIFNSSESKPVRGIEPPTYGLQNRCSTVELHRQVNKTIIFIKSHLSSILNR